MRVCFVSNVVYPYVTGGAEKRIHEIATRLSDNGHDVTIYGRHFWDGPSEIEHEGVTLRAVAPETDLYSDDRRSITEAIDFAARLAYPLSKQLHKNDHDLVVASVFPYFPVLSSKLASLGTDVPVITTWHEVWQDYWNDYLGALAPFGKFVEHLTVRVPQNPIAVSGITADRLADIGPDRDDIEVVPNGIDVDQIRNAPLPEKRDQESFDVLFAGRLIADKNVSLLLDAFDSVANEYDVTLGIVGDGPEFDRLQRQAENLNHTDRVDFLGFLDEYEDVLGHMRAADVFASPSTREGFGITYAEAMAADCTVIGAQHPESAASEVIGDAGYLAEPTVDSVTESLKRALAGETPATQPTKRAEQYDWDSVAEQAEKTYKRAINRRW
ncbi:MULTISPECIES: glycosyltransferase family 4 protein [Haloferax]|uniref:Glycosyltransferase n=2 Tax=Haloferax TaxID=2251 RepID=A0A6G1Z100_9EURY|nr:MULTISPECIES: glycosyltransferase family 4 protein [Haloferax]KAB1187513.1 glycosyltransferase family 4 protein [Haloferax sp. CBA1149]MRW80165.1 glycosyltransferase [Haloferax marinisediminis]